MHLGLEQSAVSDIGQKLRALQMASATPLSWDEFKRRQILERTKVRFAQRLQVTLVAIGATVMLSAIAIWSRTPTPRATVAQRVTVPATDGYRLAPVALDEAAVRSAASERWLAALPAEPVIVRVGTRAAVTNLEDRIAWVDDTLTLIDADGGEGARASALQHERDRLINSLAQVRYAETLAAGLP
jgi:hypothetical protein